MCLSHPKDVALFLVHGKTVFHETSPWCQKGWELLQLDTLSSGLWRFSMKKRDEPVT